MKLIEICEGDIVRFPSTGKRELDAILRIEPTTQSLERELFTKLEHFIINENNPMSLRLKALERMMKLTGERLKKLTAKDVEKWADFAKETDVMVQQVKKEKGWS